MGTILYEVNFGGDTGPTHKEWWTISSDGSHAMKLTLSDDFSPKGFTSDGKSLYGTWKVSKLDQLAIFPLVEGKAAAVPSTVVLLPRGIRWAKSSPDGKRFAITADPRTPDPLQDVRHLQEPEQTSLYVVNVDGTSGQWWCSNLKNVSEVAWNPDATSLALLSPSPRIGHHDVRTGIDVCSASGTAHVADPILQAASDGLTTDARLRFSPRRPPF
jgi:WD40 repeat protein